MGINNEFSSFFVCSICQDLQQRTGISDLVVDRFQQKARQPLMTPSTQRLEHEQATQDEEVLRQFLAPDLRTYLTTPNDATLFIKALVADGIDPCNFLW